jgi:aryl-alcohol dehydrogenase-like predicted oxidoreductase
VTRAFSDQAFDVVEVLKKVASEVSTTPARAALAWVQQRPGVTSTIIGARTIEQLEDNLGALAIKLTPEQIKKLDDASQPKLNFPHEFLRNIGGFGYNGSTIDGVTAPVNPLSPQNDQERY